MDVLNRKKTKFHGLFFDLPIEKTSDICYY